MKKQTLFILFTLLQINCHSSKNISADKSLSKNYLITGYYYLSKDLNIFQRQLSGTTTNFYINPNPIITTDNFTNISVDKNIYGDYYLHIDLDKSGGDKWSECTAKTIGDSLAIILNDELVQVIKVNSQITAPVTAINRKGMTKSQVDKYCADIKAKMKK